MQEQTCDYRTQISPVLTFRPRALGYSPSVGRVLRSKAIDQEQYQAGSGTSDTL